MKTTSRATEEKKSQSVANAVAGKQNNDSATHQLKDNSPEAGKQAQLQAVANDSQQAQEAIQMQALADNHIPDAVTQLVGIGDVIQLNGDGDKKKGDDYCNNIGKTLGKALSGLPGFINGAIEAAIAIINENRHRCSVSTHLADAKGSDTNTEAYGKFAEDLAGYIAVIEQLLPETDFKYAHGQIGGIGKNLMALLDQIPNVAVDDRVAAVVRDGDEGEIAAVNAIDAALRALRKALKERMKEYILALLDNIKHPKKRDDDDDPDSGAASSSMAGGSAIEAH